MQQQKYIRVNWRFGFEDLPDVFILFSPLINHADMAHRLMLHPDNIISAGFVQNIVVTGQRQANCHGKSVTLRKTSLPEDTGILNVQHYDADKKQKFVRLKSFGGQDDAVILIPYIVMHSDFTERLGFFEDEVISAGFVSNAIGEDGRLKPECYGNSESLELASIEDDTDHLTRQHYSFLVPDPFEAMMGS